MSSTYVFELCNCARVLTIFVLLLKLAEWDKIQKLKCLQ
jgi:hypothetical protein